MRLNSAMNTANYLWTAEGARLTYIRSVRGLANYHWIFLPGGPGIGAEYFTPLTERLTLPGTLWHLDLPGNGSNPLPTADYQYKQWGQDLVTTIAMFDNPVLVGHSYGGYLALSTPELQKHLAGLVLMNAAPGSREEAAQRIAKQHQLPDLQDILKNYLQHPSAETFRQTTLDMAPYFFSKEYQREGRELYQHTALSYAPFAWACQHYFPSYQAQWVPEIPTLIINGEYDFMTPPELFKQDARFCKDNIKIVDIKGASHHPWVEQREAVCKELIDYALHTLMNRQA